MFIVCSFKINQLFKLFSSVWARKRVTGTHLGVSNQPLKPLALEECWSDNLALTIGRLSAVELKPVIRPIDEEASHRDPIKTHWLLNSLIDAPQNRKRYLSYSQSGSLCHVVYGVQEGPVLIKTLAVRSGRDSRGFSGAAVFYGSTNWSPPRQNSAFESGGMFPSEYLSWSFITYCFCTVVKRHEEEILN